VLFSIAFVDGSILQNSIGRGKMREDFFYSLVSLGMGDTALSGIYNYRPVEGP
jgi:hypothetical protein